VSTQASVTKEPVFPHPPNMHALKRQEDTCPQLDISEYTYVSTNGVLSPMSSPCSRTPKPWVINMTTWGALLRAQGL
jgi:hypothetical protein